METKKNKGGAKPKFDFEDEQNLLRIEGWARDGADDKQIAKNIGYNECHFSTLKGKYPKLAKALKKGRAPLDFVIESKLYRKAMGMTVETQQAIKVKDIYFDDAGRRCEKERVEIVTLKQEIPTDTTAAIFWLKNRKPEQWNRQPEKIDVTTNGNDIVKPTFDADRLFQLIENGRKGE